MKQTELRVPGPRVWEAVESEATGCVLSKARTDNPDCCTGRQRDVNWEIFHLQGSEQGQMGAQAHPYSSLL